MKIITNNEKTLEWSPSIVPHARLREMLFVPGESERETLGQWEAQVHHWRYKL